ncbi:MAG: hypothetical protein AAF804_10865 [Bacteroidota bacterium]
MKKALYWILSILGALFLLLGLISCLASKPLPPGTEGVEADALAQKMLRSINSSAWDSTGAVSWRFAKRNEHLWDRERNFAEVKWKKYRVLVDLATKQGVAFKKGERLDAAASSKLVEQAYASWVNDSFWLIAPTKAFDPGTSRSLVALEDGSQGLLVSYSSGGVTPGDSYLWYLDSSGKPTEWRMWVSVLPIKGLSSTWQDWQQLPTGAEIATTRKFGPVSIQIEDLKGARHLEELLEGKTDPFLELAP